MTKYLIGCGIAGLIYNYYNPGCRIISLDVGGKLNSPGMENTILLHDCEDIISLLQELNITNYKKKTHIIKYFVDKKITNNLTPEQREQFIKKKLDDDNFIIKDKNLSTDDFYIPIIEVDMKVLIEKLSKNIDLIKDKVIRITPKEIICENGRYNYEEIVSTIPAPIFWKLYNKPRKFNFKPVTFILTNNLPKGIPKEKTDLLYIIDKDIPITRTNKRNNKYLCECTGIIKEEKLKEYFPKSTTFYGYHVDNYGVIFTDHNNIPPKNIKFLGRFSIWNHSYKINHIVADVKKKYNFESMYNEQMSFNSNFFDYNVKDEKIKQELLREFIINLGEEIGEFGRLVLKKNHRPYSNPNREEVLHEYIDIMKYVLGLANVFGFTMDDIYRAFWEKSELVRKKYDDYKGVKK